MSQLTLFGASEDSHTPFGLDAYDWTFKNEETNPHIHGLNDYPAQFPPQIPNQLINHFTRTGVLDTDSTIFDPFCGSGTTVVEAYRNGVDAVATDINPFACWLSRTKTTPIDPERIRAAVRSVFDDWHVHRRFLHDAYADGSLSSDPTAVKKDWFPEPQVYEIESLHRRFREARGNFAYDVLRVLRIALAETARIVSYQKDNEFKRMRISEDEREEHNPSVTDTFFELVDENLARMRAFREEVHGGPEALVSVHMTDARDPELLPANSVDAIITSPPYGDHSTTVAYGQFSRDQMVAATPYDQAAMRQVDKEGLGGRDSESAVSFSDVQDWSAALSDTVDALADVNGRSEDALEFFTDYAECLRRCATVLKPGQPAVFVVGNRTMSRIPIPTHIITEELGEAVGLAHECTVARSIPSKRLPTKNAPENVTGETGEMMESEHLVTFKGRGPTA